MPSMYCKVSILPIRKTPQETSDMISQMLYGETCVITEKQGDYAYITTDFDAVSGWVFASSLAEDFLENQKQIISQNFVHLNTRNTKMLLSFGSEVQVKYNEWDYIATPQNILYFAKKFLNTPYLYGGRSIFGVDASALVQLVYKVVGISLPRFAYQQANLGTALDFVEESIGGELAFFDDEEGNICHTGIMLNNNEILHCYGSVRIDAIDSIGIFNTERNKHTHKLRFIKKFWE